MTFNFSSPPNRRFLARLGGSVAVVLIASRVAKYWIGNGLVDGPLAWGLAILPGLGMLGAFYAVAMLIVEQTDEFIRMLVVRQFIVGAGTAFVFAAAWGFLEYFALVGHIYPYYFAVAFFGGFGFGGLVNRITHGAWGEMS